MLFLGRISRFGRRVVCFARRVRLLLRWPCFCFLARGVTARAATRRAAGRSCSIFFAPLSESILRGGRESAGWVLASGPWRGTMDGLAREKLRSLPREIQMVLRATTELLFAVALFRSLYRARRLSWRFHPFTSSAL